MTLFKPEEFLILVVDDVNQNLQVVGEILEKVGYGTTFATSGMQAIERIKTANPDLILLDLMMPGINGLEVCEKIKSNSEFVNIPIIFLTASQDENHLLEAFEKGAVDYVTKPFKTPELLARVRTHLELKYTRDQFKKLLDEQAILTEELEKLATTDPLTGVWNRRHLFALAEREITRVHRYNRPLSLLIIDIDHFKIINDTYGHAGGDEVLAILAKTVLNCLRKADFFGRFGGEEFVAFLPETTLKTAVAAAERIRENLANIVISVDEQQIRITVSIGVASYQKEDLTIDALLQRADKALYQAKNQGRNQVAAAFDSD
ncbi:MAG: diguanylate cyclase [Actinomycetota bacterium]